MSAESSGSRRAPRRRPSAPRPPPRRAREGPVRLRRAAPDALSLAVPLSRPRSVNFGDGGRPTVVLFFARYAKGEYHVQESISRLAEEFAGRVNFIGVKCVSSRGGARGAVCAEAR